MPYAAGRVFHDADSHVMEPADWLVPFADAQWKDRLLRNDPPSTRPPVEPPKEKVIEGLIAGPKGRLAYGACDPAERINALDELGFASDEPEEGPQRPSPASAAPSVPSVSGEDEIVRQAPVQKPAICRACWKPFPRTLGAAVKLCENCR